MRGSASRPEYIRALTFRNGFQRYSVLGHLRKRILVVVVHHSVVDDHTLDDEQIKYGL
jgi:hypothetical protein